MMLRRVVCLTAGAAALHPIPSPPSNDESHNNKNSLNNDESHNNTNSQNCERSYNRAKNSHNNTTNRNSHNNYYYQTFHYGINPTFPMSGLGAASTTKANLVEEKLSQKLLESGAPGLVCGVLVDGKLQTFAVGQADAENRLPMTAESRMRIASISKPLSATALAELYEAGKVDLNARVQKYVPSFPEKKVNGETVDITIAHLAAHLSGIRHYGKGKTKAERKASAQEEFLSTKHYPTTDSALEIFAQDDLTSAPGTKRVYSTYGYTLLSAVVEKCSEKPFVQYMEDLFARCGMPNTSPEHPQRLIPNRARQYRRYSSDTSPIKSQKQGKRGLRPPRPNELINAPSVDNSNKWAGGGFVSTVGDLCRFGYLWLQSFKSNDQATLLQRDTVEKFWKPVFPSSSPNGEWHGGGLALGWVGHPSLNMYNGHGAQFREAFSHSGGSCGGSSQLFILPAPSTRSHKRGLQSDTRCGNPQQSATTDGDNMGHDDDENDTRPSVGVVVCLLTNLEGVSLQSLAREIALIFDD
eukprot:m.142385 g.142385  ORF g.142385 m.142385 type:complete len:525 (-) comp24183_c0_seq7:1158-2732(-)